MNKDLYFLNSRDLSVRLHDGEVSDDLAFKHLLLYSMLFSTYLAFPVVVSCASSESSSWWYQTSNFIMCAAIQFWGMNLLYKTNESGDGKEFFLRWAALSLPGGIQVGIISIVLGALYGGIVGLSAGGWASGAPRHIWLLTSMLFAAFVQFIHFKLMQQNLTICSSGPQQAAAT